MRRATSGTKFLRHDGRVVGVSLGFDFCSEHEQGIVGVAALLGLKQESADWVEGHRICRFDSIHEVEVVAEGRRGWGVLVSHRTKSPSDNELDARVLDFSYFSEEQDLTASWSKHELCVVAWSEESISMLKELLLAIKSGNAVLSSGSSLPFAGGRGPCFVRTDYDTSIWVQFSEERAAAARLLARQQEAWAKETEGLGPELIDMSRGISVLLSDTEALTYNYYNWPAHYLPVAHGKQGDKPDRFVVEGSGTLRVWLNPNRQDLFLAAWVSSADLWGWTRGDGPLWPLGAMMPALNHPFWRMIRKKLPPPDKGEWAENYPWSQSNTYVEGEYLWTKLAQVFGFTAIPSSMVKGAQHSIFALDHEVGEKQDLTTAVTVQDVKKLEDLIDYWNGNCQPGFEFQPHIFGRGQPAFCTRLAEAKEKARKYREEKKNGLVK